jgi:hypothetical protein
MFIGQAFKMFFLSGFFSLDEAMSPFVMSCAMLALGQVRKPIPCGWAELIMFKAVFGCV